MVAAMGLLYKICQATEWQVAREAQVFTGSAIDHADGFIHLSGPRQVRETAARHFAGLHGLVLVSFEEAELAGLQWKVSRGGALFPHVHGVIDVRLARSVDDLPLLDGRHRFPAEIPA